MAAPQRVPDDPRLDPGAAGAGQGRGAGAVPPRGSVWPRVQGGRRSRRVPSVSRRGEFVEKGAHDAVAVARGYDVRVPPGAARSPVAVAAGRRARGADPRPAVLEGSPGFGEADAGVRDPGGCAREEHGAAHHGAAAAGLLGGFHQIRAHRGRQALGRRRPEALIDSIRFDSIRPCIHGSIDDVNRYCY